MIMVLFWKACINLLDKSSSSQNEWNDRKLLMNWQELKSHYRLQCGDYDVDHKGHLRTHTTKWLSYTLHVQNGIQNL